MHFFSFHPKEMVTQFKRVRNCKKIIPSVQIFPPFMTYLRVALSGPELWIKALFEDTMHNASVLPRNIPTRWEGA